MDGAGGWFGLLPPGDGGVREAGRAALWRTRVCCKSEGNGSTGSAESEVHGAIASATTSNPRPLPPSWSLLCPGQCSPRGCNASATTGCFGFKRPLSLSAVSGGVQPWGGVEGRAVSAVWREGFRGAAERMGPSCSDSTWVFPGYLQSRTASGEPQLPPYPD